MTDPTVLCLSAFIRYYTLGMIFQSKILFDDGYCQGSGNGLEHAPILNSTTWGFACCLDAELIWSFVEWSQLASRFETRHVDHQEDSSTLFHQSLTLRHFMKLIPLLTTALLWQTYFPQWQTPLASSKFTHRVAHGMIWKVKKRASIEWRANLQFIQYCRLPK